MEAESDGGNVWKDVRKVEVDLKEVCCVSGELSAGVYYVSQLSFAGSQADGSHSCSFKSSFGLLERA